MIIAITAMSVLVGVVVIMSFATSPAEACGRCWKGQSDEHRSGVADEHLEYAGNNK
jgi:hypothetical protein